MFLGHPSWRRGPRNVRVSRRAGRPRLTHTQSAFNRLNKAHLIASAGDYDAAIALVVEAADIASRTGYRHHQAALLDHLADLHHRAGRREEAERALTDAVTIFADIHSGDWKPELWLLRQW